MMRKYVLATAFGCGLCGCALFPAPQSPAQSVYEMKAAFLVALDTADAYAALPPCPATPLCADAKTLAAIRASADAARTALDAAQTAVTDPAFAKDDNAQKAVAAAKAAVSAFASITTEVQS